jgi:hypothetical protein
MIFWDNAKRQNVYISRSQQVGTMNTCYFSANSTASLNRNYFVLSVKKLSIYSLRSTIILNNTTKIYSCKITVTNQSLRWQIYKKMKPADYIIITMETHKVAYQANELVSSMGRTL